MTNFLWRIIMNNQNQQPNLMPLPALFKRMGAWALAGAIVVNAPFVVSVVKQLPDPQSDINLGTEVLANAIRVYAGALETRQQPSTAPRVYPLLEAPIKQCQQELVRQIGGNRSDGAGAVISDWQMAGCLTQHANEYAASYMRVLIATTMLNYALSGALFGLVAGGVIGRAGLSGRRRDRDDKPSL